MNLKSYRNQYTFDKGLNLIQQGNVTTANAKLMIACQRSNRAIDDLLYSSLNLNAQQKANLNQTLLDKRVFDPHGNQLKVGLNQTLGWDYRNMLQATVTDLKDENSNTTGQLKEYNIYAKAGQRNRKITEKTDANGSIIEINEAMYLGNLEYRTTWKGENLSYDGETVTEVSNGEEVTPYEKYTALRIRQGHKQVAQKARHTHKAGVAVDEKKTTYSLDNNIDSCEMTLNNQGKLESYEAYKPYGESAISYGRYQQQCYCLDCYVHDRYHDYHCDTIFLKA